jgi:hypothetical protein
MRERYVIGVCGIAKETDAGRHPYALPARNVPTYNLFRLRESRLPILQMIRVNLKYMFDLLIDHPDPGIGKCADGQAIKARLCYVVIITAYHSVTGNLLPAQP